MSGECNDQEDLEEKELDMTIHLDGLMNPQMSKGNILKGIKFTLKDKELYLSREQLWKALKFLKELK